MSILRDQIFVLDHMYMSVFTTCGWILRLAVTVVLLASIHPGLVLLGLFALPTVLTSSWRPTVERNANERGAQSYRLAFWRVASEEINYRRFFDITELAAVRMEEPAVFQETHRLLMRLIGEGKIQGLRIDHPDGLKDPAAYFRELQQSCLAALTRSNPVTEAPWNCFVATLVAMPAEC